jgi:hypothetical protein
MGIICLYVERNNNRGFELASFIKAICGRQHCGDGLLVQYAEQSGVACAEGRRQQPLVVFQTVAACGLSEQESLRQRYADSELWEITRDEWNARQVS